MKEVEGEGEEERPSTRQRIIEAAAKLFSAKGLDGTSIRDIASEAGESLSNIYYYFDDKLDLWRSVTMEIGLRDLAPVLAAEADETGDSTERLRRLFRAYIEAFNSDPRALLMIVQGFIRVMEQKEPPMIQLLQDRYDIIEQIVLQGIQDGEFEDQDAKTFCNFFLGTLVVQAFNNVAAAYVSDWPGRPMSQEELEDYADRTIFAALKNR